MEDRFEREARRNMLRHVEHRVGNWPSRLPGVVNFPEGQGLEVGELLGDGVHRLEASTWQFMVVGGKVMKAVRADMTHYRAPAEVETVHALADPAEALADPAEALADPAEAVADPAEAAAEPPEEAHREEPAAPAAEDATRAGPPTPREGR